MRPLDRFTRRWLPLAVSLFLFLPHGYGQSVLPEAQPIEHPALGGAKLFRLDRQLFLVPAEMTEAGSAVIPRFCGSLRSATGLSDGDATSVSVHPEPDTWTVRWRGAPADALGIALEFDQPPKLPAEQAPAAPSGDGSVMLSAFQATTSGEKLRYEPQPFKNTVGYWTEPNDTATWRLRVDTPGRFNVGILQGCGEGHGGSRGAIHLHRDGRPVDTLEFEVLETGHFQNFQWRHLGELNVPQPGVYSLTIAPEEIRSAALMDVRAVHLVPVPAKPGA